MRFDLAGIATRPMPPLCNMFEEGNLKMCKMLEASSAKLKPGDAVKSEPSSAVPSPAKKLASELERKLKGMKGDTSFVKDRVFATKAFFLISRGCQNLF